MTAWSDIYWKWVRKGEDRALAITSLEQSVMWIVKELTS